MKKIIEPLIWYYKSDIPASKLKAKYTHSESKYIELDGMQVHYRDEGNPADATPLVLIHGTSSSLHTWDDFTDILKKNHRVVRFDIPGFGLTGPNPKEDYSFEYYASFVIKMLDKLNIKTCYLAGNSLGGGITWVTALNYPERIKKMILLNADTGMPFELGKGALGFKLARQLGTIPVLKYLPRFSTPDWSITQSVQGVYYDKKKIKPSTYELYKDFTLREGNRKALVQGLTSPFVNHLQYLNKINTKNIKNKIKVLEL